MTYIAGLESWIAGQFRLSAAAMERAISATQLVRHRETFGQVVVPAPGSVLASPVFADWDPEPDYFFNWVRDSAIVMRSVAELMHDSTDRAERDRWRRHFEDFVRFSLTLCSQDGAALVSSSRHREATHKDYRKFLRPDAELRKLAGEKLLGEPRFLFLRLFLEVVEREISLANPLSKRRQLVGLVFERSDLFGPSRG